MRSPESLSAPDNIVLLVHEDKAMQKIAQATTCGISDRILIV